MRTPSRQGFAVSYTLSAVEGAQPKSAQSKPSAERAPRKRRKTALATANKPFSRYYLGVPSAAPSA